MAKKIDLESEPYDFDGELDMPDFDFDGPEIKDDRHPATKIVVAAAEGFRDTALSSDNIRNLVKKSLPRGYGEALDVADMGANTIRNIYNTTAKEIKPLVTDMRKTAKRLIPAADKILPKSLADSFRKFAEKDESNTYRQSEEDAKEASLQAEIVDIFKEKAQDDQLVRSENDARDRIKEGIALNRHEDNIGALSDISANTHELSEYQRNIGINFQRKMLELNFRHYFVSRDSLEEQKRQNAVTTASLEGILKNTGLPEYVKLKNTERLGEMVRNKFISATGESLSGMRRNFMKNLGEKVAKAAKDKVRDHVDAVKTGLGAVDSLAELNELQSQFGPSQSGAEMGAGLGGGLLAGSGTDWLAHKLHRKTAEHEKIASFGNKLSDGIAQMPQRLLAWANSQDGIGKANIGSGTETLDFVKESIRSVMRPQDTTAEGDTLTDIRNPDIFNRRTNRSITDIIPGFLARIYRELRIMRTGDANQELVEYDFTSNRFNERSKVKQNIFNSLVGESDKRSAKRDVDDLVNELDKENKLSPEQKSELGRILIKNNLKNGVGDSKKYSDAHSNDYRGTNSINAEAFAKVFQEYFKEDKIGAKQAVFGRQFGKLGDSLSDKRAMMQDFVNTNQRDHLEELGLLDKQNNMNMDKLLDYILGVQPDDTRIRNEQDPSPDRQPPDIGPSPSPTPAPTPSLGDGPGLPYRLRQKKESWAEGHKRRLVQTDESPRPLPHNRKRQEAPSRLPPQYGQDVNPQTWDTYHSGNLVQRKAVEATPRQPKSIDELSNAHSGGYGTKKNAQTWQHYHNSNLVQDDAVRPETPVTVPVPKLKQEPEVYKKRITPSPSWGESHKRRLIQTDDSPRPVRADKIPAQMRDEIAPQQEEVVRSEEKVHNPFTIVLPNIPAPVNQSTLPAREVLPPHLQNESDEIDLGHLDLNPVVDAIETTNATTQLDTTNEILLRIEKKINEGITLHGGGEGSTESSGNREGRQGRWWNRSIGNLGADAWETGGKGLSWLKNRMKRSHAQARGIGGAIFSKAKEWGKDTLDYVTGKAEELSDVFVKGVRDPVLSAVKMRAGEYFDAETGEPIIRFKDIKGAIKNRAGELVLSAEQAKDAFIRSKGIRRVFSALTSIKDTAFGAFKKARGFIPVAYRAGLDIAKYGFDKVSNFLDRPQDVYVTGKPDPVLLAVTMGAGGYRSRISGDVITRPSQIVGPVLNDVGNVVLTEEDLAKGLLDKFGKPMVTGWKGLLVKGKRFLMSGLNKLKDSLLKAKDWTMKGVTKVKDVVKGGIGLDVSIGRNTKTSVTLLQQIRDLLNARLPGEPTKFDDEASAGEKKTFKLSLPSAVTEKVSKLKEKIKERFNQAKDKVQTFGDEEREKRSGRIEKAKEKLRDLKDKIKEKFQKESSDGLPSKLTQATEAVGEKVSKVKDFFQKLRKETPDDRRKTVSEKADELKNVMKEKVEVVKGKAATKLASLKDKVKRTVKAHPDTHYQIAPEQSDTHSQIAQPSKVEKLKKKATALKDTVKGKSESAKDLLRSLFSEVVNEKPEKGDSLKKRLSDKAQAVKAKARDKFGLIKNKLKRNSSNDTHFQVVEDPQHPDTHYQIAKPSRMAMLKEKVVGIKEKFKPSKEVVDDPLVDTLKERTSRFASLKEKATELKEKADAKKEAAKEKLLDIKSKAALALDEKRMQTADLLQRLKDKRDAAAEKAKAESDADKKSALEALGSLGGDGDGDDRKKRMDERRRRRAPRPRGFLGKSKALLSAGARGVGGLARGALALSGLSSIPGIASAAVSGAGAIGGGLMTAGSAAVGGLATAAGWAGSALAGIAGLLSAPVALGALGAAAVGVGGYYAYKYLTKKKLDTYSKIRYAQYGFLPQDTEHLQGVFGLEDCLKDAVSILPSGQASIDDKKVDIKKALANFEIDQSDKERIEAWCQWFALRFKPVFLTHVAAIRNVDASKWLDDVVDLKPQQKRQYLNTAKLPDGPYGVFTSPFAGPQLTAGEAEVNSAIAAAEAELTAELIKDGKKSAASAAVGAAVATAIVATDMPATKPTDNLPESLVLSEKPDNDVLQMDDSKLTMLTKQTVGGNESSDSRGLISVDGPEVMADIFNTGRLDAMTAIRFKTYGLKELSADKVRALTLTEIETLKGVTFGKGGRASFDGSIEKMVILLGTNFGVEGINNASAYDWVSWFNTRFLPTYLAYLTAMCTATKKTSIKDAQIAIRPIQLVEVATMTYTAKGSFEGNVTGVWQIPVSPWPGYTLNDDVKSIDGNMQGLKDKAKQSNVEEETARIKETGMESGSVSSATASAKSAGNKPEDKPGFFSRMFGGGKSEAGDGKGGGFIEGVKGALGFGSSSKTPELGQEINQPGKGTGGDINDIPKPTGNGTWNAVKGTISAAAKMVGVDEKLMATMAAIESGFNWSVKAGTSSATGLYQFIKSTWDTMIRKYGPKYGIDPATPPTDPRANALMGAEFLKENANAIKGSVNGRKLTDTDLYLAHFLGAGGAKKFLSANQDAIAANAMPDPARANPSIFFEKGKKDGRPLTFGEVYSVINGRVRSKGKQFGIDDGSEKVVASANTDPVLKASAPLASTNKPDTTVSAAPTGAVKATVTTGSTAGATEPAAVSASPSVNPVSDVRTQKTVTPAATAASAILPVSDQTIAVTKPPTNDKTGFGGFESTRSRDVAAQQEMQRDKAAEALVTTNQILASSHKVQSDILKVNTEILAILKVKGESKKKDSGVLQEPVVPATPAPSSPRIRQVRDMTTPPVSMRRDLM